MADVAEVNDDSPVVMDVNDPSLVHKQNVYREELDLVQTKHNLRRSSWWSLVLYIMCVIVLFLRASSMTISMYRPGAIGNIAKGFRKASIVSMVSVALIMAVIGLRRDAKYAKHAWDQRRFPAPDQYVA